MKLLSILGTRPQIVKAAPLQRAIDTWNRDPRAAARIDAVVADTGQHYDPSLAAGIFDDLELPRPKYTLDPGRQTGAVQLARMLAALDEVFDAEAPDIVLVYGDTTSTLAGALAARQRRVRLAHVEAGLRSFNRSMQEETNRVVTDHVADLLFCPTPIAVENLRREGIVSGVHLVGDVMEEALRTFLPCARAHGRALERLSLEPGGYLLVTLHRAETVDERAKLAGVLDGLGRLGRTIVWPCHPRARARLEAFGLTAGPAIQLIEPLGYRDMLQLEDAAAAILTDSGGVQREAAWLGVPCLVLREETEWLDVIGGSHALAGTTADGLEAAFHALPTARASGPGSRVPMTSRRILDALAGVGGCGTEYNF